jgi:serine phosphatase RsbU (regulator of sigma subunit)/CHASE1-domain containing sensor protein
MRGGGRRRDGLAIALPVVLVALLLLGGIGVAVTVFGERDEARTRDRELAELARTDVTATVGELVAALAGASTIVDGSGADIALDRWTQFATAAVEVSILESLALEVAVADRDRAAFEAMVGPILEPSPQGLVNAGTRDRYLPVRDVVPVTDESSRLFGFDIAADPTRRDATVDATAAGELVISAPLAAQPTGQPAFFVVKPLFRQDPAPLSPSEREAALVGFITTAVSGRSIIETAAGRLPADARFTLLDQDFEVGSTDPRPDGGEVTTFTVAGREWQLVVDDGRGPGYLPAWLLAVATLIVTASIALVLRARIQVQRLAAVDAHRHAQSAELGQRLAEARTTAGVADAVRLEATPLFDAVNASVRTVDDSRQVLQPVIDEGLPPSLASDIGIDAGNPAGQAVIENRWVLIRDSNLMKGTFDDDFVDALLDIDYLSLAFIPLENREHEVVGLLGVAWDRPRTFDATTMALLRSVGELCEQTLERARLHDSEHHLVQRLQHGALSAPPRLPGLEVTVRYESAMQALSIGGDWYDAIVLDDHTVALVVGDVAGHGVPAVAEMIELRSAIHALLRADHPLDQVLTVADDILTSADRTRIATALVAVFDSQAQQVEYSSAGHPPALLRRPNGEVEILMDGRRPVLGVAPPVACPPVKRPFDTGSVFVAYTDGLIERRHEDLLVSINRLAKQLRTSDLSREQLADLMLASRADTEATTDDVALVVALAT